MTHAFQFSAAVSQEQHLPWLSCTTSGRKAACFPEENWMQTYSFAATGRSNCWCVSEPSSRYEAHSAAIIPEYRGARDPAGLYILFLGPEEDVRAPEQSIRSGSGVCTTVMMTASGYVEKGSHRPGHIVYRLTGSCMQLWQRPAHTCSKWERPPCGPFGGRLTTAAPVSMGA